MFWWSIDLNPMHVWEKPSLRPMFSETNCCLVVGSLTLCRRCAFWVGASLELFGCNFRQCQCCCCCASLFVMLVDRQALPQWLSDHYIVNISHLQNLKYLRIVWFYSQVSSACLNFFVRLNDFSAEFSAELFCEPKVGWADWISTQNLLACTKRNTLFFRNFREKLNFITLQQYRYFL
jgi:hypothetical protein